MICVCVCVCLTVELYAGLFVVTNHLWLQGMLLKQLFFPPLPPLSRALVFVAHGAGEHCGPYDEIAQTLKDQSLMVFAHDHG